MLANVITIGLPLVVMGTMFTQGLRLKLGGGLATFKDRPLVILRSLVVVIVLVPIVALAIILLFKPPPGTIVALAILAASPAATFQLRNIYKKGGNAAYLQALHLSLALLAIITVPVVLFLLSEALGFEADVTVFHVGKTVMQAVLLPVVVGILFGAFFPKVAVRIEPPLSRMFEIGLVLVAVLLVIKTYSLLLRMDALSYVVMIIVIVANIGLGHVLGPRDAQERTTLAIESGERNTGLAMSIGVLNFSAERTLPVFIPYIVLYIVISSLYLKWRERDTATGVRSIQPS
jgi:bile acid:Na+ symporter, BASS family